MTSAHARMVERLREQGSPTKSCWRRHQRSRHIFADEALASALMTTAIGLGQTISQPWVVADDGLATGGTRLGARNRHRVRLPDGRAGPHCAPRTAWSASALVAKARRHLQSLKLKMSRSSTAMAATTWARRSPSMPS
jgi:hypothetical protein